MSNKVLIVEDDHSLREALSDTLNLAGFETLEAENGIAALDIVGKQQLGMIVSDVAMDGMDGHRLLQEVKKLHHDIPILLMTAYGDIAQAVNAMRNGAVDYLVKPFEPKALVNLVSRFVSEPNAAQFDVIAHDPASLSLLQMAGRVAKSSATVLINGESGTGKEVIARYIHQYSPRAKSPFVAINCAAIPENMLEATLFGYEKGAFTGAYAASAGKFEQAQHGTLLLDEITEMDLGLQAKLLRVLQERELERLGGKKTIELDVRVLATTNKNIEEAVACGDFREDLYYRINVVPLQTIALRDRVPDIIPIAEGLMAMHAQKMHRATPSLSAAAKQKLQDHDWPGNVRELDNVVQRSLIFQPGATIEDNDVHFEIKFTKNSNQQQATVELQAGESATVKDDLKNREFGLILQELQKNKGCRKATAENLGISPRTLRYKLARMRERGFTIPSASGTES